MIKMDMKLIILVLLAILPLYLGRSQMKLQIQPKDSTDVQERTVDSGSFSARADSSATFFLIFFDKNPDVCDQQAYINVAPPVGQLLQKGRYENISGQDSKTRTQPFVDFYYTEPNGLRYHCLDNDQTGFFEISEVSFNREGEVSKISLSFEIHCVVNGQPEKRAAKGTLSYQEDSYGALNFLE
jgi:hypothetical protein